VQLVTIDDTPAGSIGAKLSSGEILHLGRAARPGCIEAWLPTTMRELLAAGREGLDVARTMIDRAERAQGREREQLLDRDALRKTARLLPPIPDPSLIVAAGLSYRSHLQEMAGTPTPPHPTAFLKSPASVSAPGKVVRLPPQASTCVDYEGELACIFGATCHNVAEADALSYLAGYTAANDVSARDWVGAVWSAEKPWEARLTWEVNIMGKQMPGFTPLGPVLTTVDEIPDPAALRLSTRVNGHTVQNALVSDLIFSIPRMIAHFSKWYTFRPGDVLLTGTPAGVGVGRQPRLFMKDGDLVEVEIDRIGTLATRFVATL
jgi:acylpyruvate hydrolase